MTKTLSHAKENTTRFHRMPPAKRASAHKIHREASWERIAKDTVDDDAVEFDDELVRLIDDCAQRAMAG